MRIKIIAACLRSIQTSGGAAVLRRRGLTSRREMHAHLQAFYEGDGISDSERCGYRVLDYFVCRGPTRLAQRCYKEGRVPRAISFAIHEDLAVRVLGGS